VGRVLDKLDELDIADDTLVLFVADHGEELYQRNRYFYHACSVYQSVLHVPLIVRLPGVLPAGRRIADPVELSDIVPTVLEIVDEPDAAAGIDGVSLVPLLRGTGERTKDHVLAEWYEATALAGRRPIFILREGDWKLVYNPDEVCPNLPPYKFYKGASYPIDRIELYNLREDPLETRNRAEESAPVAGRLRGALERFLEERKGHEGVAGPMNRETIERLIEIGYITPGQGEEFLQKLEEKEGSAPDRGEKN
jgi:arylsulfatase A-like enzyme